MAENLVNAAANAWEGNELKDALVRLGLTDVAAREFMENGVTDVHRLRSLDEKALTRLIKTITKDRDGGAGLVIPFMAQEYTHAMLFWAHRQFALGLPFDAALFHLADAEYWMQKMREQEDAGDATRDLIKTPEIFKKDTKWLIWSESLITYLRSQKGVNNAAPLAYFLHDHDVPTPDMFFYTDTDEKIGRTILAGPQFNWTVRDFYTLGDEFAYVALVQKADKKIKTLRLTLGTTCTTACPRTDTYTICIGPQSVGCRPPPQARRQASGVSLTTLRTYVRSSVSP